MLSGRFLQSVAVLLSVACSNSSTHGDDARAGKGGGSEMSGAGGGAVSGSGSGGAGASGAGGAGAGSGGTLSSGGQAGSGAGGLAGSAGMGGMSGAVSDADALVVPQGVSVMGLPGGHGVLEMFALTIRKGPTNTEMYAALKNVGDRPVCDGALTIELYDKDGNSIASAIGGLLTDHLYRLTDGSGSLASCVGAGEVTMASMTDLSLELDLDNIGYAVYRNPYFGIQVEQIEGFTVTDVLGTPSGTGTTYTGTLVNGLDEAVTNPTVMIYPVNAVGRPLGMATATATDPTAELAPGASWSFTSNTVDAVGIDYHAYVTGSVADTTLGGAGGQTGQSGQGGQAGSGL
ncbi:MAG TPA: FxLYD domain-containing protein [Polyangiaceae bacterium]|nr:FxLYD domain-containing protein [Polyangiaceae bacterium]